MSTDKPQLTAGQAAELDAIGTALHMRNYARSYFGSGSGVAELTPVEYVFLSAHEFYRQIHINGYDGFLDNTGCQYADFLPIALSTVGAFEASRLARLAWRESRRTKGEFDDELMEACQDLPELLYAYLEQHRSALPSSTAGTPEAIAKHQEELREYLGRPMADRRS